MATKKITWPWLESRLEAVNARWLEVECGFYRGKLNDVKRGKVSLTDAELALAGKAIASLKP